MGMREIAPFGLRLTPKLKAELDEAAKASGRSLQKEILMRLEQSIEDQAPPRVQQPTATYEIRNDAELEMVRLFRSWPAEKQLGFLALFKGL